MGNTLHRHRNQHQQHNHHYYYYHRKHSKRVSRFLHKLASKCIPKVTKRQRLRKMQKKAERSDVDLYLRKNVTDHDMQVLLSQTHFTPIEFKLIKEYFLSITGTFLLDIDLCKRIFFAEQFKNSNFVFTEEDDFVLKAIFNAVNTDDDGLVSFAEFVYALSVAVHGSFDEKAKFSFRLYDADGNGTISVQEMIDYTTTLYTLGILKVSTKLQTRKSRGDQEQETLQKLARTRAPGLFSENLPHTPSGLTRLDIQHETSAERYPTSAMSQQPPVIPSEVQDMTSAGIELSHRTQSHHQILQPQAHFEEQIDLEPHHIHSYDEGLVRSDSIASDLGSIDGDIDEVATQDGFNPTINEIRDLIIKFFGDKEEVTFEEYIEKSKSDKYLIEGLGMYDYIFFPFYQPIKQFLNSPTPNDKTGILRYQNEIEYQVKVINGMLLHFLPNNSDAVEKRIPLLDVTKVNLIDTRNFSVFVDKKEYHYQCILENDLARDWVFCMLLFMIYQRDNRFNSFAPVRPDVYAHSFVDGDETYTAMAHAMLNAKTQILIAGWCVSPHIYLNRHPESNSNEHTDDATLYRLDNLILYAAKRGVKIFMILWHETTLAGMNLNTILTQKQFAAMHPNIHVLLHPPSVPYTWTHHQKLVIVDQVVGFVGGLDLAWGRYDTHEHTIVDNNHLKLIWPGNDLYNGEVTRSVSCKSKLDSFRDTFDRDVYPRMPWHDIHSVVTGKLAVDLAANFIGRWNHHGGLEMGNIPLLPQPVRETSSSSLLMAARDDIDRTVLYQSYLPANVKLYPITGQAIRSISTWSGALRTERSIQTAYIHLIKTARHYIYIENQYFCSHTPNSTEIENLVGQAIIDRIGEAITENQVFRIYVMMPMHPDGDPLDSSIQQIIKYQRDTIVGIFDTLKQKHPTVDINRYIVFLSLCNYGYLQGVAHFNQIYIHSKLMIADDRVTIIGSANINDRSLVGSHDSEIAVYIEDVESTQSVMNGTLYRSGRFARNLRQRVWREHLGLEAHKKPKNKQLSDVDPLQKRNIFTKEWIKGQTQNIMDQQFVIRDPVSDITYNTIRKRAKDNTELYQSVFAHYPSRKHEYVNDYREELERFRLSVEAMATTRVDRDEKVEQTLAKISGHVVEYPLYWFNKDPFKKDIKLNLLNNNTFY
jgi:phosphatidylserine/phosphatidylglycerophosphate/cardiolipin synthase-like enzyme/Ca2+-binding EF-hand superfamily protein